MVNSYVIGLDFGSDSVRSVLVNASNGEVIGAKVHWYERWKEGKYCKPEQNQFRQHPLDHVDGMESTIRELVAACDVNSSAIKGICVDTTGSSPIPVNESGEALAMLPEFSQNPNAMMVLWKDHTAIAEAEEITQLAKTWGGEDYTRYVGGTYSSEWFWAKVLHIVRQDDAVKRQAYSWVEHCDYMTYLLTGGEKLNELKRSRCAAGHKAMWHESWGGLPSDTFLGQLDPYLVDLKKRLYTETYTADQAAGRLSSEWAQKLGLTEDTVVAVGTFDAHAGAIGAEVKEHTLVRVMGTSTCDIIVSSKEVVGKRTIHGICGQVDGAVIPGLIGLEAGQSAFGDVLAWFKNLLSWPLDHLATSKLSPQDIEELKEEILTQLSTQAEQTPIAESAPLALDWVNGRRTPDANQNLKAAIMNLSLGTQAPHVFRALVESICYGSKLIVDRFETEGVPIKEIVGIGGVAKKSTFIMQTLANVLNMPIKVAVSDQAPALGAAMYAAVAAGLYPNTESAIAAMGNGFEKTYHPQPELVKQYQNLYSNYQKLGGFVESSI
ncbi:ribulokinase [Marinoscillum furvescens]|uniref:Ribulokinase n=1 Tax=Marinoscillum furvescens DSM 4134 TaxID=1122208 RepID=A0A3D9L3R3_MARFU|nr:ribulokinase [Marinoscillum furvescens]RED97923.1 L-ribulokinase [Marinoscillum furvescens DSM 4134]